MTWVGSLILVGIVALLIYFARKRAYREGYLEGWKERDRFQQ